MTLQDLTYALLSGYVSVPLAALANRNNWPSSIRFLVALAISCALAAISVLLAGNQLTADAFLAAFGPAFAAQQTTWHLRLHGAGDPAILDPLGRIGSPSPEASPEDSLEI